jgi:hypothetical protein
MNRLIETQKRVTNYLKDNNYLFECETFGEDMILYSIEQGIMTLKLQFEFYNKEQEEKYPDEYCILQAWVEESDNFHNNNFTYYPEVIKDIEWMGSEGGGQ